VREDLNRIYITGGCARTLKVYDGTTYSLLKSIPLRVNSNSIGYDPATHLLYVDNGGGDAHESFSMLSIVDTTREVKGADVKIGGDTLEAMALERSSDRMYVNNAAKNEIVELSRKDHSIAASWPVELGKRNVAMALDEAGTDSSWRRAVAISLSFIRRRAKSSPHSRSARVLTILPSMPQASASMLLASVTYVYQLGANDEYTLLGKVPSGPGAKNGLLAEPLGRYLLLHHRASAGFDAGPHLRVFNSITQPSNA
jgi:hypothetical protein